MKYNLQYTDIFHDGELKGIAFTDRGTDYIRFQIAAPTDDRNTWHIISVCRGGSDPFEFVSLGHEHSRTQAIAVVRRAWVAFALSNAVARQKNKDVQ